jgi:xanthine dehydrogenase YagR molybdenum-binding subunit
VQRVKVGAKKDGSLTAIQLRSYGADGLGGGANCAAPYNRIYGRCPNVKTEESDVHIHAGRVAAMRAPGHPQGSFGLEQALDMIAEKIGMDPLELRKKNDNNPIRLAQYALGAERIGWSRRKEKAGSDPGPRKRGFGLGSAVWGGAGGPGPQVEVRVKRDGTVEVLNGSQDLGTGTRSLMAIVAAEELGLPYASVSATLGDTRLGYCGGSGGSQTAASLAPAVRNAAYEARLKLAELAAPLLGVKKEEVEIAESRARVAADPGKSIPWAELCAKIDGPALVAHADRSPNYGGFAGGAAGVQFAEVEVDVETGEIHVVKVVAVHDCGRVVNRMAVESQINGGVIQGLSYALLEDRILDRPTGRMVNPNLEDYKILGALETPEIESIAFDVANGMNSVGLLGIGESPVIPTAAAVANAVANATGARVFELPMTPDRVLAALARGPVGEPQ